MPSEGERAKSIEKDRGQQCGRTCGLHGSATYEGRIVDLDENIALVELGHGHLLDGGLVLFHSVRSQQHFAFGCGLTPSPWTMARMVAGMGRAGAMVIVRGSSWGCGGR